MDSPFPDKEILNRYTILVLDDDESLQFMVKAMLEKDYDIIQTFVPEEALDVLRRRQVDLIILDLMLPGISGIALCRRIKEEWKEQHIPVLILTARTDLETKIEALEAGADDYATKPFQERELLTRIKVQLRIRDLQQELVKTERLKAVVETAISANHEINNPLCAIINNAELMMASAHIQKDEESLALLGRIFSSALRIEKTIKKMANIIQPAVSEYLPGIPMLDIEKSKVVDHE
jgi:DNA-binding response OmpR family regulator